MQESAHEARAATRNHRDVVRGNGAAALSNVHQSRHRSLGSLLQGQADIAGKRPGGSFGIAEE